MGATSDSAVWLPCHICGRRYKYRPVPDQPGHYQQVAPKPHDCTPALPEKAKA